jgi:putative Ig domain-containing protein
MANKTDRLNIRSWPTEVRSNSTVKPLCCLPEDYARGCWLLPFTTSISGMGLFFAIVCLLGCNGIATSDRSLTTSSANSLRITTANPPTGTVQNGYSGRVTDRVQSSYGKLATAANAFSVATSTPTSVPSMPPSPGHLQITTDVLPAGSLQSEYDTTLEATGGVPPYYWDATAGQIAPGLTLRSSTGAISGIPFAPGSFSFTARVQDSTGSSLSTTLSLNVSSAPRLTVSDSVPGAGSVDAGTVVMISDR